MCICCYAWALLLREGMRSGWGVRGAVAGAGGSGAGVAGAGEGVGGGGGGGGGQRVW